MKVIIHSSESEEAFRDLELRIAKMKAAVILHKIENASLSHAQKNELINTILKLLKADNF